MGCRSSSAFRRCRSRRRCAPRSQAGGRPATITERAAFSAGSTAASRARPKAMKAWWHAGCGARRMMVMLIWPAGGRRGRMAVPAPANRLPAAGDQGTCWSTSNCRPAPPPSARAPWWCRSRPTCPASPRCRAWWRCWASVLGPGQNAAGLPSKPWTGRQARDGRAIPGARLGADGHAWMPSSFRSARRRFLKLGTSSGFTRLQDRAGQGPPCSTLLAAAIRCWAWPSAKQDSAGVRPMAWRTRPHCRSTSTATRRPPRR